MSWWWLLVLGLRAGLGVAHPADCAPELAAADRVRAVAFAAGDPARLDGVYVANSPLRAADARVVQDYGRRGGRVVGALLQVSECRETARSDTAIRLEVTESLGPAFVRWDDGSTSDLPRDRPTRRVVTLQRTRDGWRISGSRSPAPSRGQATRR
jgi:hypothetical protein